MNPEIITFFTAMTPIGELRASIPAGIAFGLNWSTVYVLSVLGNMLPPLFILLFIAPISDWLSKKFKIFEKLFLWVFERTRNKTDNKIKKYGSVALVLFVAIPFPLTGAYTGAIAAYLFNIPIKRAFPLITLGIIISATLVMIILKTGIYLI